MAGVSVTAVSFVLNEKPGVSEDTRKKVQAIIEETGFKPSLNSKRLVLNKSFNISLIVNPYSSPFEDLFYFEIMNGILNQSSKHGYNIVINKIRRGELPDSVYSGDADGMIFMQDITPAMKKKAISSGVPFVVVDTHDADPSLISVSADYTKAAHIATTHLVENGHKNIALLASNIIPDFYKQTLQGFANALLENSIAVLPEFVEQTAYNEESAYFAAKEILSRENPPTAIVCAMDSFAIGAMKCIKEMNLSVPDDVSLIGIDDILLARYIEPSLTTVKIDKTEMGVAAMDLLRRQISGKPVKSYSIPMQLVVRDSVKKRV